MEERVKAFLRPPMLLALGTFLYLTILAAKEYTWIFVSGDSGDWLAASNWWMVPQPYGAPLYILLGRLLSILPGSLPVLLTVLLSVVPSTITVILTYKIVDRITGKRVLALCSGLVLVGTAVFVTQSTILEIYALATCFLVAGFWAYINKRYTITSLLLGLAVSVHVVVLGVIVIWVILDYKHLFKPLVLYCVPVVALFYAFILLLMFVDTPPLLAGGLSLTSLKTYLTTTSGAVLGQLSVFEAPKRIYTLLLLIVASFGLAIPWAIKALQRPWNSYIPALFGCIVWFVWYYTTCIDPLSWTFLCFAAPFIAILVSVGLSKVNAAHTRFVIAGAVALILINSYFLNAQRLTNLNPAAQNYYNSLQSLPEGSLVVCEPGSYSLGLFYVMSEGKDLIPLVYSYIEKWHFDDYSTWLRTDKLPDTQISASVFRWDTLNFVESALNSERDIYYVTPYNGYSLLKECFEVEYVTESISRITALTGILPRDVLETAY